MTQNEKEKTNEFMDSDGFKIIVHETPTSRAVIKYKYKSNLLCYKYNGRTIFCGEIDPSQLDKKIAQLNNEIGIEPFLLDSSLSPMAESFDDLLTDTFDTSYSSDSTEEKSYHYENNSSGCCIMGCIFSFIVLCLILYGMGYLGGQFIEFFKGLF